MLEHGAPSDVVEVQDVPAPDVGPGEVRIAVRAASLNFGDIARTRGGVASIMAPPPLTLGMDVAGIVEAVGEGAESWAGRRVVAICKQAFGGMAELAIAPLESVFDAPPELDDVAAAAFTLPFHTTYLALHERAALRPGETVVVTAGASSLGTAAIQLAVAAGATVVAIAGGRGKGRVCTDLGATLAIDHTTEDIFERVMEQTGGRGADVACDLVGGDQTEAIWPCMAHGGRYIPLGFNDDPHAGFTGRPLRKVSMGNFSVVGVIAAYGEVPLEFRRFGINPFPAATGQRVHRELCRLLSEGWIRPVIGQRISMDQVGTALEAHEHRRTTGRTVVDLSL